MRILIIEDNLRVLDMIKNYLGRNGFSVDSAQDGETGLDFVQYTSYDAILLDLNLPDIDGLEVCRKIRVMGVSTPIVMLTARSDFKQRVLGLNTGADDYIVKPFDLEELLARLHAIIRRVNGKATPTLEIGDLVINPQLMQVFVNDESLELTAKEYNLLHALALSYPEMLSAEQIIEKIWNDEMNPFSNVIRVHIMNVRKKISEHSQTVTLKTLKGKGYLLCVH